MLAALRRAQWRLRRRGRRAVRRSARRAARLGRRLARWRWRIFPDAWLALRVALRPPTRLHGVRLRVPASLPADMRLSLIHI